MREARDALLIQSSREEAITPKRRKIKNLTLAAKKIKPTH